MRTSISQQHAQTCICELRVFSLIAAFYQVNYGGGGAGHQQQGSLVRQSIGSDLGSDEFRAHSRSGSFSYGTAAGASNPESPRYQSPFQQGGSSHHPLGAGSGLQPILSGEPVISADSLPPLVGYPDSSQYWQQHGGGGGIIGGGGSNLPSFSTSSEYSNGGGSYHGQQLSMSRQSSGQAPYGGAPVQGPGYGNTPRRQQLGDAGGGGHFSDGSYGRDAHGPPQPPMGMYGPPLTPNRRSVSEELLGGVGGAYGSGPTNGVSGSSVSFTGGGTFTAASPRHGLPGHNGGGRPTSAGGPMMQQGYGPGPNGLGGRNSFSTAARGRSYPPPPPHTGGGAAMFRPGVASSPKAPYSPRHGGGGRDDQGVGPFGGGGPGGFDASRGRGPPGNGRVDAERGQGYRKLWAQVCAALRSILGASVQLVWLSVHVIDTGLEADKVCWRRQVAKERHLIMSIQCPGQLSSTRVPARR